MIKGMPRVWAGRRRDEDLKREMRTRMGAPFPPRRTGGSGLRQSPTLIVVTGRVIAGVMTPTRRGGVVAPLIDPALLEPHRFMPPPAAKG
jgi:hypothetical protein